MFVRTTVHIGSWSARMAFVVLHTVVPLVMGMLFFDLVEPHILWRRRDACFFSAGNVDAMTIVESFAQDRTEIERLVGFAQDRVINGKTIPKPVTYAETSSHPDILKLLDDVADDNIPLGIPVPRKTNPIPLIWWNRQTHRTSGLPLVPRGRDRA